MKNALRPTDRIGFYKSTEFYIRQMFASIGCSRRNIF